MPLEVKSFPCLYLSLFYPAVLSKVPPIMKSSVIFSGGRQDLLKTDNKQNEYSRSVNAQIICPPTYLNN